MGTKNNPGEFDCYEHAEPDEPLFTLLARDAVAPNIVDAWADAREKRLHTLIDQVSGSEVVDELDQIAEARRCAEQMREWRDDHR